MLMKLGWATKTVQHCHPLCCSDAKTEVLDTKIEGYMQCSEVTLNFRTPQDLPHKIRRYSQRVGPFTEYPVGRFNLGHSLNAFGPLPLWHLDQTELATA